MGQETTDGESDGDTSDGADSGGDGGDRECEEVRGTLSSGFFPISEIFITHSHMINSGNLEQELGAVCWEGEWNFNFEDDPPYISGDYNLEEGGPLEASLVAEEKGADELVIFDKHNSAFTGVCAKNGGEYDPEVTGSVQDSVDKMVENDERFGIFSWGSGNTIPLQIIFEKVFGYEMRRDGGEINVVTAETAAVPELLDTGELALAASSPAHGGGEALYNDTIVPVWWDNEIMPENDLGMPNFSNYWVTREMYEDEEARQALGGFVRAHQKSNNWFFEEAHEIVPGHDEYGEAFGNAEDKEVIQYIMDWLTAHERGIVDEVKYASEAPTTHKNVFITDEYIEQMNTYAQAGVDIGIVDEDWDRRMSWGKFRPPQGTDDLPVQPED